MRIFVYRQRRKKIPALKENAGKGKRKLNNMALLDFLGLSPYSSLIIPEMACFFQLLLHNLGFRKQETNNIIFLAYFIGLDIKKLPPLPGAFWRKFCNFELYSIKSLLFFADNITG
jgi:hypothetical protein